MKIKNITENNGNLYIDGHPLEFGATVDEFTRLLDELGVKYDAYTTHVYVRKIGFEFSRMRSKYPFLSFQFKDGCFIAISMGVSWELYEREEPLMQCGDPYSGSQCLVRQIHDDLVSKGYEFQPQKDRAKMSCAVVAYHSIGGKTFDARKGNIRVVFGDGKFNDTPWLVVSENAV